MASGPLNPIVPPTPGPPTKPKPRLSRTGLAVVVVACVAINLSVGVILSNTNKPKPQDRSDQPRDEDPPAARRETPQLRPSPRTPEEQARDRIWELSNYSAPDAFKAIGPTDTGDDENGGAVLFGLWLNERGIWDDVQPIAEEKTSHGLVMKDPNKERGKRICVSGAVMQIRVESTPVLGAEAFGLMIAGANIYRFVAARDTGDLVANSPAKFCGFVAGKTAFSNVSGGETQGVYIVGMFDLPSNRALKRKPVY